MKLKRPEFLCIGHFCHDLYEGDYILGGTASYCSLVAQNFGLSTAVLTSVGPDFKFHDRFQENGVQVKNKLAEKTTIYENVYEEGIRTQYMYERAETLFDSDLPEEWKETPIVKFCLIADEVDFSLLKAFPDALVGATVQGWLRQWDEKGKISPKAMDWDQLGAVDVILMSEVDIVGFEEMIPKMVSLVEVLVMTHGEKGATVFYDGEEYYFPAFPVDEVDPTGAGDVFAVSFLIKYAHTRDCKEAVSFAHSAASIVVEGVGVQLPELDKVEERQILYKELFSNLF